MSPIEIAENKHNNRVFTKTRKTWTSRKKPEPVPPKGITAEEMRLKKEADDCIAQFLKMVNNPVNKRKLKGNYKPFECPYCMERYLYRDLHKERCIHMRIKDDEWNASQTL